MPSKKQHKDASFDEFFGQRQPGGTAEPYDSRDDAFSQRQEAAPPAMQPRTYAHIAQRDSYDGPQKMDSVFPEPGNRPPMRPKRGRIALLWVIAAILILATAAMAAYLFRPADGGEYYRANGSLPRVENIAQTNAFSGSVWLTWDAVDSAAGYRLYCLDPLSGEYRLLKTVPFGFAAVWGLEPGTTYDCLLRPYCVTDSGEYVEQSAQPFALKTLPGDASALSVSSASADGVTLEWQPVTGADGYEIHQYSGSWWSYDMCADTTVDDVTVSGLTDATGYTFKMRPYIDLGASRKYGSWSDKLECSTSPVTVAGVTQGQTTESGYMLSWEPCARATGYELYSVDEATDELRLIGQCGSTSYEIAGLESVTFSSYRIRAFLRYAGGISFGEYSDRLTAVTLPDRVMSLDQFTSADGVYTVSWQAADRAEGYELYAYSCHRDEYVLLATLSEPGFTLTDISQYAERYEVRAYVSLGDLVFHGEFSDPLPCYPYAYLKRTVSVDSNGTALRASASPDAELLSELKRKTKARVFAEKSGTDGERWFRVELSDGSTGWIARADVTITNECETLAVREYTDEEPIRIYLSPSRQGDNPYCIGDTTEQEQMEAVAAEAERILAAEYDCEVFVATQSLSLRERAFEALELSADIYLAIHSNATGSNSVCYGASSYYCPASGRSEQLGRSVNRQLNTIAPMACTLDKQMYDALSAFGGVGYAEVRDPYNLGMVALLAETDFHDNSVTAQWIIDSHESIGRAYALALADAFGIPAKPVAE